MDDEQQEIRQTWAEVGRHLGEAAPALNVLPPVGEGDRVVFADGLDWYLLAGTGCPAARPRAA